MVAERIEERIVHLETNFSAGMAKLSESVATMASCHMALEKNLDLMRASMQATAAQVTRIDQRVSHLGGLRIADERQLERVQQEMRRKSDEYHAISEDTGRLDIARVELEQKIEAQRLVELALRKQSRWLVGIAVALIGALVPLVIAWLSR